MFHQPKLPQLQISPPADPVDLPTSRLAVVDFEFLLESGPWYRRFAEGLAVRENARRRKPRKYPVFPWVTQPEVGRGLEGNLTATVHATKNDRDQVSELVELLEESVGRVIYNGFPTGVEVCPSQQHGGPYPASSASATTSVGADAMVRFARFVAYQDMPDELSLYVSDGGGWTQGGEANYFRRYTLRMDGFVSVNAPLSGGEFVTKPLRFAGSKLEINFARHK